MHMEIQFKKIIKLIKEDNGQTLSSSSDMVNHMTWCHDRTQNMG